MPRANLTRRFYERSPYPPPGDATTKRWRLAPPKWILSIDRAATGLPRRVLVAGCGTGSEAFLLQPVLPYAEIVGVDFSPHSIRLAQRAQAKSKAARPIRFVTADLAAPDLVRRIGGDFDLILCHGVLSYIPNPLVALRNLRRCLHRDGVLMLGVNGAGHFSTRLRPVLARLGITVDEMPRDPRWRELIKLWERGRGHTERPPSKLPGWYLGGDLFGPVNHALPLHEWSALLRRAGLFFGANFVTHRALRPIVETDAVELLLPCSRAAVCELLDAMNPHGFHRIVVTRRPPANPPWTVASQLVSWRPASTGLYSARLPKSRGRSTTVPVLLKSPLLEMQFEWPMNRVTADVLRAADGTKSLRDLLSHGQRTVTDEVRQELFLLYQFGVMNLFPPTKTRAPK